MFGKKSSGAAPSHHSSSLYPASSEMNSHYEQRTFSNFELSGRHADFPGLQDRSALESSSKKKRDRDKDKERDRENREREKDKERSRADSELLPHLPDVPGAEGEVPRSQRRRRWSPDDRPMTDGHPTADRPTPDQWPPDYRPTDTRRMSTRRPTERHPTTDRWPPDGRPTKKPTFKRTTNRPTDNPPDKRLADRPTNLRPDRHANGHRTDPPINNPTDWSIGRTVSSLDSARFDRWPTDRLTGYPVCDEYGWTLSFPRVINF